MTGEAAFRLIAGFDPAWDCPFAILWTTTRAWTCAIAAGPWEEDWPALYDAQAGAPSAAARRGSVNLTTAQCTANLSEALSSAQSYGGPSAELLCAMREWGPLLMEPLFGRKLTCASIVYSLHVGGLPEASFMGEVGAGADATDWGEECRVLASPGVAVVKLEQLKASLAPACLDQQILVSSGCLSKIIRSGKQSVVPMAGTDIPMGSLRARWMWCEWARWSWWSPSGGCAGSAVLPVCQLILPFQGSSRMKARAVDALKEQQFDLIRCSGKSKLQQCVFVSITHC